MKGEVESLVIGDYYNLLQAISGEPLNQLV